MDYPEQLWKALEQHGEIAIKQMVDDYSTENSWLEFKKSGGHGTANPNSIGEQDFKNLCKATSAFANTDGGLIVWGVDCTKDPDGNDIAVVSKKSLINEPLKLQSFLEGATYRSALPAVAGVLHKAVVSQADAPAGFVVTYVPKSHVLPHKAGNDHRFYFRSGSSSVEVPDILLAAMYGRRPVSTFSPVLVRTLHCETNSRREREFQVDLSFYILNNGPRLVNRPYLTMSYCLPSPQSKISVTSELVTSGRTEWRETRSNGFGFMGAAQRFDLYHYSLTATQDYPIPAGETLKVATIQYNLTGPFFADLTMRIAYGHEESQVWDMNLFAPFNRLNTLWGTLSPQELAGGNRDKFIKAWIGLDGYDDHIYEGDRLRAR